MHTPPLSRHTSASVNISTTGVCLRFTLLAFGSRLASRGAFPLRFNLMYFRRQAGEQNIFVLLSNWNQPPHTGQIRDRPSNTGTPLLRKES